MRRVQLRKADARSVFYVAVRMREADYTEIVAMTDCADRQALAERMVRFYARPDMIVASTDDGVPVVVGGLLEARPGVYSSVMFATDDFDRVAKPLSKFIKNELIPAVKANGAHRLDAISSVDHHTAHQWIRWMGYEAEGPPLRGYGRDGSAYQVFAWVADHCPRPAGV